MKWLSKGKELDKLAEKIMKYEEYYVWGNGRTGQFMINCLKGLVRIPVVLDSAVSSNSCTTRKGMGYQIISPEQVENWIGKKIIIACEAYEEVAAYLRSKELKENEDFYEGHLFVRTYMIYQKNSVYIRSLDLSITSRCTLKCKNCCLFMPYFKQTMERSYQEIIQDIDCFFMTCNYLWEIKILGGEPLLHPDLNNILKYILHNYGERICTIMINTNGTVMPSNELLQIMQNEKILVWLADYQVSEKYSKKVSDVRKTLENHQIRTHFMKDSWWEDMGFPNECDQLDDDKKLIDRYDQCRYPCRGLREGKLWLCSANDNAVRGGLIQENKNDYFELSGTVDKKALVEFDIGFSEYGYVSMCKLCRGYHSGKQVRAGEQLVHRKRNNCTESAE